MAGGKGTRLLSLTNDEIPKPMVSLNGKPLLLWQVECLERNGIRNIILVIGHLGNVIKEYFGDGSSFGVEISYFEETEPLGTGGALKIIRERLEENFLLIYGDLLFDVDLSKMIRFHEEHQSLATLFVHPNAHPYDSDLIVKDTKERIIRFDSKHNIRTDWYDNCVNAGIFILKKTIIEQINKTGKIDLEKDCLIPLCDERKAIFAYQSPEYVKDVGIIDRIRSAADDLEKRIPRSRNLQNPQSAIFLDRDGTINVKKGLISNADDFELESGAAEAIRTINRSKFLAIAVTNQPAVARGLCGIEEIELIHRKMKTLLGNEKAYLDGISYCPHHPEKGFPEENPLYKIPCECRKPKIGMVLEWEKKYHIDLSRSWIIGDSTVDIRTGKNAGMKTILVQTGDGGKDGKFEVIPDFVCKDIKEAVEIIMEEEDDRF